MSEASRRCLLELFQSRAVSFGRFTLASGKENTYYLNSKKALFHSESVALLGEALWDLTHDAVFAPKYEYWPIFTIRDFGIEPPGGEL